MLSDIQSINKYHLQSSVSEHYITQLYLEYLLKTVWHWREVKTINFWQLWLLIFLFQGKRWSFRSLKFLKLFWQLQDKAWDDKVIMSWWDMVFVFVFWIDLCLCLSILVGQVMPLHLFVPRQEMGSSWVDGIWSLSLYLSFGLSLSLSFGWSSRALSSFCSESEDDGVIVSWWDNQRVLTSPPLNSSIIVIDWTR